MWRARTRQRTINYASARSLCAYVLYPGIHNARGPCLQPQACVFIIQICPCVGTPSHLSTGPLVGPLPLSTPALTWHACPLNLPDAPCMAHSTRPHRGRRAPTRRQVCAGAAAPPATAAGKRCREAPAQPARVLVMLLATAHALQAHALEVTDSIGGPRSFSRAWDTYVRSDFARPGDTAVGPSTSAQHNQHPEQLCQRQNRSSAAQQGAARQGVSHQPIHTRTADTGRGRRRRRAEPSSRRRSREP